MATFTSISLDADLDLFIQQQLKIGSFSSVNEIIENALRLLEQKTKEQEALIAALEVGEKSSRIRDFDRVAHLQELHKKFLDHDL